MIKFTNLSNEKPFLIFQEKYNEAVNAGQKNVEAISISSYNANKNEVDSRFVNLKFVENNQFIFFSNYNSPKSVAFKTHSQISALIYWSSINFQIRMRSFIYKTSKEYNQEYFKSRSVDKNALSISSNQSNSIASFDNVIENYNKAKEKNNLAICPDYWGGYKFIPYEIEFWSGDKYRLNQRNLYTKNKDVWSHSVLEP